VTKSLLGYGVIAGPPPPDLMEAIASLSFSRAWLGRPTMVA
jgi:hypothetical protein